ncbi:dephospho-CoA kinase [Flavobacterium okayamense]|uniref:Dephospho-CoA kinase n=1 Tax=Flavobacterium okayamense TaxID=2830782 RepID=A0ABM7S7H6_9FLAO|nr:dephospho-CoA kinase [Flavobacterium okayamense]BCY29493.1 dephospho-CoA kinase [Flavobacterium okayamense]
MTRIIGLTGGIGSGKSTVAKYLASKGISVYIADVEARKLMESKEVIDEIKSYFGEKVISKKGKIKRKTLANLVFSDKEKLNKLNSIVHPKVKKHFMEWVLLHKNEPFIVKEVAILFETNGHLDCDKVILVTAPEDVRLMRVMQRDNVSKEDVLARMNNQMSEEEKISKSDYVIHNIVLNDTYNQIDKLLKII